MTLGRLGSLFAAGLTLFVVGCAPDDINRNYGQRRSAVGSDSVNGTAVLAKMFEQAGHRVTTWRRLSPKLNQYDVLVWIPDSFDAPSWKERQFLEQWLARGSNKVLVYVGRDFDAGPVYWRKMQLNAPAEQASEIVTRLNDAETEHATHRSRGGSTTYGRWFVVKPGTRYDAKSLRGPWAQGIDASQAEIVVTARLDAPVAADIPPAGTVPAKKPASVVTIKSRPRKTKPSKYLAPEATPYESPNLPESEVLLEADHGDALVRRVTEPGNPTYSTKGKVIVIANGSFLLNLPLVNHEHRKLADRLIRECGQAGRVAFLESDESGLETFQQEPDEALPSGLELFTIFPINAIILHLVAVGILFCFTALPIFGRAKRLPPEVVSDFGAHIAAVGELLQFTRDRQAARKTLEEYNLVVRGAATRNRSGPAQGRGAPRAP